MKKSAIVSGEASETDSDTEMPSPLATPTKSTVYGEVIKGEDSESEEEPTTRSISASRSTLPAVLTKEPQTFSYEAKYDTLLHNKLLECNKFLHAQVSQFTQHNINEATRALSDIEQQLLQSQLTLEGAITSLRSLNVNSIAIRNKLKHVLEGDFLKTIKTAK